MAGTKRVTVGGDKGFDTADFVSGTAAVKTGIAATRGDIVIVQDADLECDPAEIPDVIGRRARY